MNLSFPRKTELADASVLMAGVLRPSFPRKTRPHLASFGASGATHNRRVFLCVKRFEQIERGHRSLFTAGPSLVVLPRPGDCAVGISGRMRPPPQAAPPWVPFSPSTVPDCPICEDGTGYAAYTRSVQAWCGVRRPYVPIACSKAAGPGGGGGDRAVYQDIDPPQTGRCGLSIGDTLGSRNVVDLVAKFGPSGDGRGIRVHP